jgi:hypothetical protein
MFMNDIKLIELRIHEVYFYLTNTNKQFQACSLISKGIYCDEDERRQITQNPHNEIIQNIIQEKIQCPIPINKIRYNMVDALDVHKGFFIESNDINSISCIKLIVNGLTMQEYCGINIHNRCVRVHSKLLYFPMNYNELFSSRSLDSHRGSIIFRENSRKMFEIHFTKPTTDLSIYRLKSTKILITRGKLFLKEIHKEHRQPLKETTPLFVGGFIYQVLNDPDYSYCRFALRNIEPGEEYMKCLNCLHNFLAEPLLRYLKTLPKKDCPACKMHWCNYSKYINNKCTHFF